MKTIVSSLFYFFLLLSAGLSLHRCFLWEPERLDAPCPTITGFSPSGAPFGGIVTVVGSNFIARSPEFHEVRIGETLVPVDSITDVSESGDTLRFKVPKGAGNGIISITLRTAAGCPAESPAVFAYYYTATMVTTFSGTNCGSNCFSFPHGIDIDNGGNLWVADEENNIVYKLNEAGSIVESFGNKNETNCNAGTSVLKSLARFNKPADIALDISGDIYVADRFHSYIRKIAVQSGVVQGYAGQCGVPGSLKGTCNDDSLFLSPYCIERDGSDLYVLDDGKIRIIDGNCSVRFFNSNLNFANAMKVSRKRSGAGPVIVADIEDKKLYSLRENGSSILIETQNNTMNSPSALEVDDQGNIFIADKATHQILAVYTDGEVVPLAGVFNDPDLVNGVGDKSKFDSPSGLVLGKTAGTLFVSDTGNRVIRKITFQ